MGGPRGDRGRSGDGGLRAILSCRDVRVRRSGAKHSLEGPGMTSRGLDVPCCRVPALGGGDRPLALNLCTHVRPGWGRRRVAMRSMLTRFTMGGAAVVLAAVVTGPAFAQAVYPAGGQSPQQQQKDMA